MSFEINNTASSFPQKLPINGIEGKKSSNFQVAETERFKGSYAMMLTGRVQHLQVFELDNSEIHENLDLSRKINRYVHERIFGSRNFPKRECSRQASREALNIILIEIVRSAENMQERIYLSEKYHVGNCGEMARLGLDCPEIGSKDVEVFDIEGGDHVFLVVGRDASTNIRDPSKWNKSAVICDPWANAYYPASLYLKYLKDYIGMIEMPVSEQREESCQDVTLVRDFQNEFGLKLVQYAPPPKWKKVMWRFKHSDLISDLRFNMPRILEAAVYAVAIAYIYIIHSWK